MSKNNNLKRKDKYQQLISHLPAGFALHKIICNEKGEPVDYKFLEVNSSFEKLTGLKAENVIGRTCLEVLPSTEPIWIQRYGKVALTGKTDHFDSSSRELSKHFEVTAFQTAPNHFACIFHDITEHKKSEKHIKNSEEKFRTLAENTPGLLYRVFLKENNRMEFFNDDILFQMTGYTSDELSHGEICSIEKMIIDEDKNEVVKTVKNAIIHKESFEIEYKIEKKNNDIRILNERGKPIYGSDGNPIFIDGIIFDITRQKKTENTLRENEEKYRLLVEGSLQGMVVAQNNPVRISFASSPMEKISGYSPNEIVSFNTRELTKLIHVNDREAFFTGFTNRIAGKNVEPNKKYRLIHKNGNIVWVELYSTLIKYNGEPAVQTVFIDITDRKQAEKEMARSNELLTSVINQAPFAIHILEGKFNNISATIENKESIRILGESIVGLKINAEKNENLKTRFFTVDGKQEIPLSQMPGTRAFKGDTSLNKEFLFRHADGTEIAVQASASPIYGTNNEIKAVIVMFHDITEELKLKSYLQKSQKLESLGLLAGGIAHDFNNILSAIFGYNEIAAIKTSENEVKEYLQKSIKNIERAQALTQQLLTFAKGGIPIKKIENLSPFLEETVNFALSGSSVTSSFHIEKGIWQCNFDKNQIGQVIDNLTINAKQAMSNGGKIEVSAENYTVLKNDHPVLEQGEYVKISIKDMGIGIPKEYLTKIFDPYYSTKPKGHGLGLATCYSIVSKHDGYIHVSSEPGKGSTFSIFLPASTTSVNIKINTPNLQHKGKGTFIVMDDEFDIRDILKEMLESFGYDVVTKNDGNEVLDLLKESLQTEKKIEGMIFDLTIPGGMGGKEAIQKVRELYPDVPVFVASGYSEDPIISNPENFGFNASIRKPFMIADLSEMLEKHIKKD